MMLAGPLMATLLGSPALAASAAAGIGATGAAASIAAAGATGGLLTALGGIGTGISAVAALAGASARARAAQAEADQEKLKARADFTAGQEQAARLKRNLALTISKQRVAFASGGVDLSSVSVEQAQSMAEQDAETQLDYTQNDAARSGLSDLVSAANLRARASSAMIGGVFDALKDFTDFGIDVVKRG